MAIRLTPRHEAQVEEILTNGHFSSAEEVVDAALELLAKREQRLMEINAIFTAAEQQIAEGRTVRYTPELFDRLKREAAENALQKKPIDNDLIF